MTEWRCAQPLGSLEDRGAVVRSTMSKVALDVCGPRLRKVEGWFAARADELRQAQLKRNRSTAAWAKNPKDPSLRSVMKKDAKALKRDLRNAKTEHIIAQANACVGGGQAAFWAAVKELTGPETRARPVPSQNFRDENGDLSTTPAEAAASATAHFTKVYNIDRERPVGSAAAVASVRQRRVFWELDNPISEQELHYVLDKAKPGKSTSNQIPVELFQACREDPEAFGHLLQLIGDVFESGRPDNDLTEADPQPLPPPP